MGSCAGTFYVFDRQTGVLRWSYDIHQDGKQTSFRRDPLVLGSTALVGTDLGCAPEGIGHVYAFDLKKNAVRWKQRFQGVYTSVVVSGKEIFFGSVMGDWYKAKLSTGVPVWRYQVKSVDPTCGSPRAPVFAGGKVYILGQDSALHILDAASGKLVRKIQPPSPPATALTIYRDQILFGAEDGRLYAFDLATTQLRALLRLDGRPTGRLEVDGDSLYLFLNGPEQKGQLPSVDLNTNTLRWTQISDRH